MGQLVHDITDTARWVATFRADESERKDAIFHDPFARQLAGKQGEEIADKIGFSRKNSWVFVARTYLFDEIVKQHVAEGFDRVLNLAAGLDTRPYRLPLPEKLEWVEADLPGIISYKQHVLQTGKPNCRLLHVSIDLADRKQRLALFERIGSKPGKTLVITEGLIIYLNAQQAAELATDLSGFKNFHRWAFDLSSPAILAVAKQEMGPALKEGNIEFKFAPEEGEDFFQAHGWKWLRSWSKLKTAAILNRLSEEMMGFAAMPEPDGPRRTFPWSGVCLFENKNSVL
jgi:methyltransferase (TIGR00027 family)